jgi:DNA invertase Pin-like site-specific DNA recombinase
VRKAFGYLRIFENDPEDAHNLGQQRRFIRDYAKSEDIEIVDWFQDDYLESEDEPPPGFREMVSSANDVRTVIVDDIDRLGLRPSGRTLLVKELQNLDMTLICASTDEYVTTAGEEPQ